MTAACGEGPESSIECVSDVDCDNDVGPSLVCANANTRESNCVVCLVDNDCPANQVCDLGGTGSDPRCIACLENSDCDPGQTCFNESCGACGFGGACDPGLLCVSGECVECAVDGDCAADLFCDPNLSTCVECVDGTDCAPGQACVAGVCGACATNGDCDAGQVCDMSSGACVECLATVDCLIGVCCDNTCGSACTAGSCPAGEVCMPDGCCGPPCNCQPGEVCCDGVCLDPCAGNPPTCLGADRCLASGCCGPCVANGDCSVGEFCVMGICVQCVDSSNCAAPAVCLADGTCGPCVENTDCAASQFCVNGACVECVDSTNCIAPDLCRENGTCGPCVSSVDCSAGQLCSAGACVDCIGTADCGPGEMCVGGVCQGAVPTCGVAPVCGGACPLAWQVCVLNEPAGGCVCLDGGAEDCVDAVGNCDTVNCDFVTGEFCVPDDLNAFAHLPACYCLSEFGPPCGTLSAPACGEGLCPADFGCQSVVVLDTMQCLCVPSPVATASISVVSAVAGASAGGFAYGVNPDEAVALSTRFVGENPTLEVSFSLAMGELETYRTVIDIPAPFTFNGFDALGPANTQVGSYGIDVTFDGLSDLTFPIRAIDSDSAYVDATMDGDFDAGVDSTIEQTAGLNQFVSITPKGGDGTASTLTIPMAARATVSFGAGLLANPTTPGVYTVTGALTSVDPDTDGADDGMNNSPLMFSLSNDVEIVAPACFAVNELRIDKRCDGIALLELTGPDGVLVFEPPPGQAALPSSTVVPLNDDDVTVSHGDHDDENDDGDDGDSSNDQDGDGDDDDADDDGDSDDGDDDDDDDDQTLVIDTSCHEPIAIDDKFGPFTVTNVVNLFGPVRLKGTFEAAAPPDLAVDDVVYSIDDGHGVVYTFLIPAGSFKQHGNPTHQRFRFKSPSGESPSLSAKFDFKKCRFSVRVKHVKIDPADITGTALTVSLKVGASVGDDIIDVLDHPNRLRFARHPKADCCKSDAEARLIAPSTLEEDSTTSDARDSRDSSEGESPPGAPAVPAAACGALSPAILLMALCGLCMLAATRRD